jgi:hypothetical protein
MRAGTVLSFPTRVNSFKSEAAFVAYRRARREGRGRPRKRKASRRFAAEIILIDDFVERVPQS